MSLFRKKLNKVTPEQEEEFRKRMEEANLSKKDKLAIVLSAFLTILLPCALILVGFGFLILWIFGAL